MPEQKTVSQSRCVMNEIVFPDATNGLGALMGGRLLYLMDVCAAICAQRHANRICVTAAVDSVEFQSPILQGEVVIIEGQVNRAFTTSMEVELNVWAENPRAQTKRKCNRAYYTMVAVDADRNPVAVPPIHPETPEEEERFASAMKRRDFRHVVSGRIPIQQAESIREDFLAAIRGDGQERQQSG